MAKKPGDAFGFQFTILNAAGGLSVPDSTPTATAVHNGTDDGAVAVAVTTPSIGVYKAAGTIPVGYASGDDFQVRITVTIGGVTSAALRDYGTLDGKRVSDLHDSAYAGADTAGTATLLTRVGAPTGVSLSADVAANSAALALANGSLDATLGLFDRGTITAVTGPGSFTVNFASSVVASDLVNLLCSLTSGTHSPAKATITSATQVDSTHVVLQFNPTFSNAPAVNDSVLVG